MMAALPTGDWLNLGCGNQCPAGWVNVDGSWQAALANWPRLGGMVRSMFGGRLGPPWPTGIRRANLNRRLPWPDGSVAVVFSSHTLEHLPRDRATALLREARRVL